MEFDLSGSLGSMGSDVSGSVGWGEADEVLPLSFFISLEKRLTSEEDSAVVASVSKSSRQMRNKAVFDLLHETLKKR